MSGAELVDVAPGPWRLWTPVPFGARRLGWRGASGEVSSELPDRAQLLGRVPVEELQRCGRRSRRVPLDVAVEAFQVWSDDDPAPVLRVACPGHITGAFQAFHHTGDGAGAQAGLLREP